jgi:transcription elongation factor GreB
MAESNKRPLTTTGFYKLSGEYRQLWEVERPKVVQGVADAAAEGDRSENAEYIYGKKRLREIDKRLKYLTYLLKDVEIIDTSTLSSSTVIFGATVTIRDEQDRTRKYKIVGEGETEIEGGTISYISPIAAAIMGKKVGDVVEVELPGRETEIEIVRIEFV